MRDPFNGLNPFTGVNDGLTAPIASPLVWEIDVVGQDSPPRLLARAVEAGLEVTWRSRADSATVQASAELVPPNWSELTPHPVVQSDGFLRRVAIPLGGASRYFRVVIGP